MKAIHYFHKGLANNTHRTYSSTQRQNLACCHTHQLTAIPASQETLSLFMVFLADRLKPQSIKVYLVGVGALHINHRFHSRFTHTIKLQQTFRHSSPAKQKLPITFYLLYHLQYLLDPNSEYDVFHWAAMASAHFQLLRVVGVSVPNKTSYDIETLFRLQDIALHIMQTVDEYVALHLLKSKTDQQQREVVLYAGHALHKVCAVRALKTNIRIQHARPSSTPSDPLFQLSSGPQLACRDLTTFLSMLLRLVGLDPQHYSGHSFCISGATSSIAGLNDYIRNQTAWLLVFRLL